LIRLPCKYGQSARKKTALRSAFLRKKRNKLQDLVRISLCGQSVRKDDRFGEALNLVAGFCAIAESHICSIRTKYKEQIS